MHRHTEKADTNSQPDLSEAEVLAECILACIECAKICDTSARVCLGEPDANVLVRCIRLNIDCADICELTARMFTSQVQAADAELLSRQAELCAFVSAVCAVECERHAKMHQYCGLCAAACRRCVGACGEMARVLRVDRAGSRAYH